MALSHITWEISQGNMVCVGSTMAGKLPQPHYVTEDIYFTFEQSEILTLSDLASQILTNTKDDIHCPLKGKSVHSIKKMKYIMVRDILFHPSSSPPFLFYWAPELSSPKSHILRPQRHSSCHVSRMWKEKRFCDTMKLEVTKVNLNTNKYRNMLVAHLPLLSIVSIICSKK